MDHSTISRKGFLKNSVLGLAGLALIPEMLNARPSDQEGNKRDRTEADYLLKNVRLETGFEYENGVVVATRTELFMVEVVQGKIKKISANKPDAKAIDAQGMLMLPSFKDMHIHLDKTYYGGPWKAVSRRSGGVKGMIALEQEILPGMFKDLPYRAGILIELMQSKGTAFTRSHVNIEPTSKLDSLKSLQKVLETRKDVFGTELVAFPQHGVFYTESAPYLTEAARMGVDFIGGLDPYSIDGSIEKTMDFTVGLALEYGKGIDIHLHESGDSGLKTIEYLIDKVNENPVLKGKTFLSHCFILGKLEKNKLEEVAEKLGAARIGIVSTIPFGNVVMPIPLLWKHGVSVQAGNDSIVDHWNTFGSGSVLQKANLAAQLYGYSTELELSRMLKLATNGIIPLNDEGKQQWPIEGDAADMVFVEASCSAEAVSRVSDVRSLIYKGTIVF